jgi:TolB-like protein
VAAVAAAVVAIILAASAYIYVSSGEGAAAKNSIAVLPFQNASGDPDVEYLSDGITESLINSLSQLPNVRVMARSTMFSFKGKETNPQEVGRQLGVDTVLTGRVVQRGDSLTVQADLVNVADGSQLWGERYNRRLTDVLAVQGEIARDVLNKLRAKLSPAEEKGLSRGSTANPEAYRLYLTGRYVFNSGGSNGVERSVGYFRQAVDLDPRFALAYAGMADAYTLIGTTSVGTARPREMMPKAKEAAQRALELDSGLSEAHTSLAWVKYRFDWDWQGAEEEFKRALELNPNNAQAHQWYADYLLAMGRFDESLAEIERARALDPLSIFINWDVGRVLYHAGRFDESLAEFRKTLVLNENFARTHWYLVRVYLQKGMDAEALAEHLKFASLTGVSPERILAVKGAYGSGGWKAVWRRELEWALEDSARSQVSPLTVAQYHARVGDRDGTLEWLNKSVEERLGGLVYLKIDDRWDFLRTDPRFAELARKVGLPQ